MTARLVADELPAMPQDVAAVFSGLPPEIRARLEMARRLIFQVADATATGPLTETLKWGEPAYLTTSTKSGSTIRLGRIGPDAAVLFNCQTTLIAGFKQQFGDVFRFSGNRALLIDASTPWPEAPLAICLGRALAYHRDKRKGAA